MIRVSAIFAINLSFFFLGEMQPKIQILGLISMLHISSGNRDNLGIISHYSPLINVLGPSLKVAC